MTNPMNLALPVFAALGATALAVLGAKKSAPPAAATIAGCASCGLPVYTGPIDVRFSGARSRIR